MNECLNSEETGSVAMISRRQVEAVTVAKVTSLLALGLLQQLLAACSSLESADCDSTLLSSPFACLLLTNHILLVLAFTRLPLTQVVLM